MQGLPIDQQLAGFSDCIYEAGLPMKRVSMGMRALHPRYGAVTYVWRPGENRVEYSPRERTLEELEAYRQSPVQDHHGQILEFMGDRFLATFDLTALDEEAVCRNAFTTAAELRQHSAKFNRALRATAKPVLDFGLSTHFKTCQCSLFSKELDELCPSHVAK